MLVPITIFPDNALEHDEVFTLQLYPVESKVYVDPSEGDVRIINDDCKCLLQSMKLTL